MFRSHLVESRFICIKGALVGVEVSAFAISSEGFGWVGDILMRPAETEVLISDPRLWVPAEKFLKDPSPAITSVEVNYQESMRAWPPSLVKSIYLPHSFHLSHIFAAFKRKKKSKKWELIKSYLALGRIR